MSLPIQPVIKEDGVVRFRANTIVKHLLDTHPTCDMNALARMDFSNEDRAQFAQLIGYSLCGYAELDYVSDEAFHSAERVSEEIALASQCATRMSAPLTDLDHNSPPPVSWQAAKFQPWHGGPCPLCPQEIVTVKTQGGEERTGLAKDFQWVWKDNTWISNYPFPSHMRKARQLNVVGFTPVGGCQKLTGAACQPAQPKSEVELTMAGKIALGLVVGFAFYGLSSLLRGA